MKNNDCALSIHKCITENYRTPSEVYAKEYNANETT